MKKQEGKKFSLGLGWPTILGIVGGVIAACTIPGFGLGLAALVGLGTGVGSFVGGLALGIGGAIAGTVVGGVLGLVGGGKGVATGAIIGASVLGMVGGVAGTGIGAVKGYDMTKTAIQHKACAGSFNKSACPTNDNKKSAHAPKLSIVSAPPGRPAMHFNIG